MTAPRTIQVARIASGAIMTLSLLLSGESQGVDTGTIKWDDYAVYVGEIEIRSNPPACTGGSYCGDRHCAHGTGRLTEDRGKLYEGTFVHGCPDGMGTYSTEVFTYVGSLKMGTLHGHGKMTCAYGGRSFEGEFVNDSFDAKPFDRWYGLCPEAE